MLRSDPLEPAVFDRPKPNPKYELTPPEFAEPRSDCGYGDGIGDLPSEISVTAESAPGEAWGFREKKDVNLLPGDAGFFASRIWTLLTESIRRGGGLSPGFNPILFSDSSGTTASLNVFCCTVAAGGLGKSSIESRPGASDAGLAEK